MFKLEDVPKIQKEMYYYLVDKECLDKINNLQSKIDKVNEYIENNLEVNEHDDYVVYLGKNENELLDILKEDK